MVVRLMPRAITIGMRVAGVVNAYDTVVSVISIGLKESALLYRTLMMVREIRHTVSHEHHKTACRDSENWVSDKY